jgi:hypothetical protein
MPDDRRHPILQFCVFCDAFAEGPGNKKSHVGVFDLIMEPSVLPQMGIGVRWIDGIGTFSQSIRILKPDLTPLIPPSDSEFTLPNRVTPFTIQATFGNVRFEEPGVYWVELLLDGERHAAFPLPVFSRKSAPPTSPSPPPKGRKRSRKQRR